MEYQILQGDVIEKLRTLPDESVNCVVTSPPYWGLRDYGTASWVGGSAECDHLLPSRVDAEKAVAKSTLVGSKDSQGHLQEASYKKLCGKCGASRVDNQIGLEASPDEFIARLVSVFSEVRRVLRNDGTIWVNMGDTYAGGGKGGGGSYGNERRGFASVPVGRVAMPDISLGSSLCDGGNVQHGDLDVDSVPARMDSVRVCKPKDLVGVPWMLAFALRSAGWYLRQDIIWEKPNAMPESVTDRCTKSHEYIFLLSKSKTYFYDADAIREPFTYPDRTYNSGTSKHKTAHLVEQGNRSTAGLHDGRTQYGDPTKGRNKRSVWTVTTSPYKGAHFATFPTKLIEPCVLAGCPKGGTVLDPFSGSGTTGVVALSNERNYIGIELNPEYVELSHTRIQKAVPLFITKPVQKMDELEEVAC